MTAEITALIRELNHPHNDFPSYFTDLAKRAADALESKAKTCADSPDTFTVDTSARILHKQGISS
jgi:hypothetical protein